MLNTFTPLNLIPHSCFLTNPLNLSHSTHRHHHHHHRNRIRKPHFSTGIFHSFSAIDKHQENKQNHRHQEPNDDHDADEDRFTRVYNPSPIYLNEIKQDSDGNRCESRFGILSNMWWADLKAAVGQRINVEGLLFSVSVITRNKQWVIPHVSVPDVRYIDWAALKKKGFEGVVFDKDNTLTVPYSLALWGLIAPSVESCKSVFGNNIAVFSNSAGNLSWSERHYGFVCYSFVLMFDVFAVVFLWGSGLQEYDPDGRKARALELVIGIQVIRHSKFAKSISFTFMIGL